VRAWELAQQGWEQKKIAEALGVTEGAVSRWMKIGREQEKKGSGARLRQAQARLTAEQPNPALSRS
jgi:predicted transcriptional regulator